MSHVPPPKRKNLGGFFYFALLFRFIFSFSFANYISFSFHARKICVFRKKAVILPKIKLKIMGFFSSWLSGVDEEDISKNAAIITGLMLQEQNYQGNLRFLGFSNCSIDINYRGGHTWFITITVLQLRCVRHFYSYSPLGPVKDWLREIAKMYNKDPMYFEEPVEYLFQ